MFIKVEKTTDKIVFVNLNQVVLVDRALSMLRTSDGDTIFITDESLEDVLDGIGYNYN